MQKWVIDKSFSFCYGHRVWSQQLVEEFCETGDYCTKCRHLHGHEGLLHVFLEGTSLERGMVTDFKHLGWLKNFIDNNIDHKFILDTNDPWFNNIVNGYIGTRKNITSQEPFNFDAVTVLNLYKSHSLEWLNLVPVYVPETEHLAGHSLDVSQLSGPEQEFYEGFFLVDFLPTSENLCKWIYECAQVKMKRLGITVQRVEWNETPKSRSTYFGQAES